MTYLAHTENAKGVVHNLDEHLKSTAERAACLMREATSDVEAEQLARWCGLLHDAGKYRDEFQAYLRGTRKGDVDTHHAVYGAALAAERGSDCAAFGSVAKILFKRKRSQGTFSQAASRKSEATNFA